MLVWIRDDTWNVHNMQHIIPNSKRWDYSAINKLKDPPTWLKVATTLEKPPTPTHWLHQAITWINIDWSLVKSSDSHIMAISKEMPQRSITKIGLKIIYKISLKFPRGQWVNTLRPRQNGRHFTDDVFKCIFLNGNLWISIKFQLGLFLRVQFTIFQHWFR